jgi:uncharacterized SAM-binding protein YcdF (DUF218 family)
MNLRRHWMAIAVGAAAIAWLAGLVWFVSLVPRDAAADPAATDAIVVLTGGSQRVENGLTLLAEGKAKKLFVSGVYRSTDVKALLRAAKEPAQWLTCCIELGHEADNTRGNAAETAAWMRAEKFHSLRLVTASYHMPRSLLEFSRAMPDIRIVPNPVFPTNRAWWLNPHAALLVVGEYVKYLFALTGLQSLGPAP